MSAWRWSRTSTAFATRCATSRPSCATPTPSWPRRRAAAAPLRPRKHGLADGRGHVVPRHDERRQRGEGAYLRTAIHHDVDPAVLDRGRGDPRNLHAPDRPAEFPELLCAGWGNTIAERPEALPHPDDGGRHCVVLELVNLQARVRHVGPNDPSDGRQARDIEGEEGIVVPAPLDDIPGRTQGAEELFGEGAESGVEDGVILADQGGAPGAHHLFPKLQMRERA